MKRLLILIIALLLSSCGSVAGDPPSAGKSAKQTSESDAAAQLTSTEVKVTKNGKTLTSFQSVNATALLVDNDLSIEIISPGQNWVLSLSSPAKTGSYRLAAMREKVKAMIVLTGGEEARLARANTGALKLNEVSEAYCSGSFTGSGTDATGNKYIYEGKFSGIRATRQK